jgi:2-amino-4-hydroxy-6-hydroxymethyldihydropteridine diphosphokinase
MVCVLAHLSLGSNLGNRGANLQRAIEQLRALGEIKATSSIYETEPMELTDQPQFLNCVVALETDLSPQFLLANLLEIERKLGRDRKQSTPKGPRLIDIDIALFGDTVLESPELTIPHPAMHLRRFVLAPLAEIAPDAIHPVFMRSAADLLNTLGKHSGAARRLKTSDARIV